MAKSGTRKAVCPGSFDPVTFGHLDVFARAAEQYDHVTVAVLQNSTKAGLFTMEQRIEMITECVKPYPNIVVDTFHWIACRLLQGQRNQRNFQGTSSRIGL
jgi:pantetheine-phosphate adenylyltransferase